MIFTLLTTWATGRALVRARLAEDAMPLPVFIKSAAASLHRVRGTSVFLASSTPIRSRSALLHNIKHNQVLHERVVILTVKVEEVPHVAEAERVEIQDRGAGLLPRHPPLWLHGRGRHAARSCRASTAAARAFNMMSTSFFLGRQKLIASKRPGMALWREHLFAWMMKNSRKRDGIFKLPTNRVVELGSQLEI